MTNKYFDLESNNLQNLNSKAKNVGRNNNKMREVIYKTIDLSNKDREVNCSYNSLRSSDLRDPQASGQELRLSELEYDSIRNSYATERNDNLFSSKPKEDDLVEYECSKYPEKDSDNPFEYQPTTNENSSLIDSKSDQNTSNINEAIFIQDEMRVIPKDQQNELRENQDSANSVAASLVENENKFDIKDLSQSIIQNQNLESLPNSNDESLIDMKEKTELTSEKQESYISNQSNLQQNENSDINENKEYTQTDKKLQFIPNEDLNPEESHPYLIVQKDKIFESDLNSTQETISLKLEEIQPEKTGELGNNSNQNKTEEGKQEPFKSELSDMSSTSEIPAIVTTPKEFIFNTITFKMIYPTTFGQEIFIIGSHKKFGSWIPENTNFGLKWSNGNIWTLTCNKKLLPK